MLGSFKLAKAVLGRCNFALVDVELTMQIQRNTKREIDWELDTSSKPSCENGVNWLQPAKQGVIDMLDGLKYDKVKKVKLVILGTDADTVDSTAWLAAAMATADALSENKRISSYYFEHDTWNIELDDRTVIKY